MSFSKLLDGYDRFYESHFGSLSQTYKRLVEEGQQPETLVIACSDSRVDPALLTKADPGDLFVVRNVAAIVPPCEVDDRHHGTSAAIEFAVRTLKVKHIIVLGHALCGGARALADHENTKENYDFLGQWIGIGKSAREAVMEKLADAPEDKQHRALEQTLILTSLDNLMTFPWVSSRVKAGDLKLHGWYFDMNTGRIAEYDHTTSEFNDIAEGK
ncbi:carbonic anhydrase [bacterium]|nr:carbonic anhydrase [bacterium]